MKKLLQKLPSKKSKIRGPVIPVPEPGGDGKAPGASNRGNANRARDGTTNIRRDLVEPNISQATPLLAETEKGPSEDGVDALPASQNFRLGTETSLSGTTTLHNSLTPGISNHQLTSISPDGTNSNAQSSANAVGRYCKAVLKVLGCMTSVYPGDIVEDAGKDGSAIRTALEDRCRYLLDSLELFKTQKAEESKIPAGSIQKLHDSLSHLLEKIRNKEEAVDIESLGREISWKLEAFLIKVHWAGYISGQDVLDKVDDLLGSQRRVEEFSLTQAVASLPRVGAAHDTGGQTREPCFEGTRTALIEEIAEWFENLNESMYVLAGPAGTGKSTIAQTVATKADGGPRSLRYLGASFFFSRNEVDRQNAQKFFTTIAFQLCVHYPEFAMEITEVLKTPKGLDAVDKKPTEQLRVLIIEPLRKFCKTDRRVVIVVDALDECRQEDRQTVFTALKRLVHELPFIKVFLTTRENELKLDNRVVRLQDIETKIVEDDIRRYLKYHLSWEHIHDRFEHLRKEWSATEADIDCLARAAGNLFIVASTSVHFILDGNPSTQMRILRKDLDCGHIPFDTFDTLHNFYRTILQSVVGTKPTPLLVQQYQWVVGAIMYIQHPLHVETLALLIDMEVDDVTTIIVRLKSVILLGCDDIPLIYHKSFPDYLEERCDDTNLRIVKNEQHTQIAIRCFQVMNQGLRRNILELGDPARFMDNNEALKASRWDMDEKIPPHLRYACTYWANHLKDADRDNPSLKEQVDAFASTHLLHWLEALSWMHKLHLAYDMLDDLSTFARFVLPGLSELLSDGLRFTSKFLEVIQRSALHTYYSALPFTPTETRLYKQYFGDLRDNLCQVEGGPEHWDAMIVTFGQRMPSGPRGIVKFSRDGSLFADFHQFDEECDVRVRHATSGVPVTAFHGEAIALSEDFSVAAQYSKSTVEVYRVSTNALITAWDPCHATNICDLNLSHDGSRLAICSTDGNLSLWDTSNGENIIRYDDYNLPNKKYEKYTLERRHLAFSTRNDRFAYSTQGGSIQLCDGTNGDTISSLTCQSQASQPPCKPVFSPDGSRIASLLGHGLPRCTLALWDAGNGGFIGSVDVAEDLTEYCDLCDSSVAFSADGSVIATAAKLPGSVKLWRAAGENPLSLLDSLSVERVNTCLAFSSDILAVGHWNIGLYDAETRELKTTLPFDNIHSLTISPDQTRLAAKKSVGPMSLWDLSAINSLSPGSKKKPRPARCLAFSPDCSHLAVSFHDETIELWNVQQNRKVIALYKTDPYWATALAFSPDGQQLAYPLKEEVQLLNSEDGTPIATIPVKVAGLGYETRKHCNLLFSGDMLILASDQGIKVWDLRTHSIIHTFSSKSADKLSISADSSLLAFIEYSPVDDILYLKLWDLAKRSEIATFDTRWSFISSIIFSPNNPRTFAIQYLGGSLKLLTLDESNTIQEAEAGDHSWLHGVPWQGAQVKLKYTDEHGLHLLGRFPGNHDPVPVLKIPNDFVDGLHNYESATGSSMFAIGSNNGHVLIIRSPRYLS